MSINYSTNTPVTIVVNGALGHAKAPEHDAFKHLASALIAVPKSEIDEERQAEAGDR